MTVEQMACLLPFKIPLPPWTIPENGGDNKPALRLQDSLGLLKEGKRFCKAQGHDQQYTPKSRSGNGSASPRA